MAAGSRIVAPALIAAGLLLATSAADGQTPADKPAADAPAPARAKLVTNPDWLRKPTGDELWRLFPSQAQRAGKDGSVTLNCLVQVTGLLKDCVVVAEEPRGLGFGGAALAMASMFKMRPVIADGKPEEGMVFIPISFKCSSCSADASQQTSRLFTAPTWAAAPTFDQWKAAYPIAAQRAGVRGGATLECGIKADGGLTACRTTNELPGGMGFAAAAKTLTPFFTTGTLDYGATNSRNAHVQVTVAWTEPALAKDRASGEPDLVKVASPEKIDALYPKAAGEAGLREGKATVSCDLNNDGAPANCVVRSETPVGMGFGQAAVALAPEYRFNLWTKEGLPVMRRLSIPLSFGAPKAETVSLDSLVRAVETLVQSGRPEDAKSVADEIRRRFPDDASGQRAIAIANFDSGDPVALRLVRSCREKALKKRDLKGAMKDCDAALARVPNAAGLLDSRAFVSLQSGDFKQAIVYYDRALAADQNYVHSLYGRGLAKLKMGNPTGEADLAAALKRDPRLEDRYAGYGVKR